jgi:hypothetical protein
LTETVTLLPAAKPEPANRTEVPIVTVVALTEALEPEGGYCAMAAPEEAVSTAMLAAPTASSRFITAVPFRSRTRGSPSE